MAVMQAADTFDGTSMLADAVYTYLDETESKRSLCERHSATAAIHTASKSLELYRMFRTDEATARQIRQATSELPDWTESMYYSKEGRNHRQWEKMRKEIEHRVKNHAKLHDIITRGISWDGFPVLVHAYKFEPDTVMKVELILGEYESPMQELSLSVIASLLQCHEHLVPHYIANALPPYERHETKFQTISEYLSQTMPKKLYATQCLQRVSCHASNGVGSRDTLREHLGSASHSEHAKKAT